MSSGIPVLARDTIRLLDRLAIEALGIPGLILMENAGTGAARVIAQHLAEGLAHAPVLVLAGPGNNGGDGFVIARHLHNEGIPVTTVLVGAEAALRAGSDARVNLDALRATGAPFCESPLLSDALCAHIRGAGCVVDALFGTGLARPLGTPFAEIIASVRAAGTPAIAVDIPSGLDADTGEILGTAFACTATATFAAATPGMFRGRGPEVCGRVTLVPISIPRGLIARALEDGAAFRAWAQERLAAGGGAPRKAFPRREL